MLTPFVVLMLTCAGVAAAAFAAARYAGRSLQTAAVAVSLLLMIAALPAAVGERFQNGRAQAVVNYSEADAQAKCLIDLGRDELVGFVAFLRREIPPRAHYELVSPAGNYRPCLALNLAPRLPTLAPGPGVWRIFENAPVPRAERRRARRYQPGLVVVGP